MILVRVLLFSEICNIFSKLRLSNNRDAAKLKI